MAYCKEHTAVKYERAGRLLVSLPCNAWTCPECNPIRKKRLIAEGMAGTPNAFLTLTYRVRDGKTPNQAALELSRAWRLVRLRLMRRYKLKKLPFLAVFEKTKAGWPHIHILLRTRYLDYKLIKSWMEEIADSPIIWIKKVTNQKQAVGYVSAYCGKATEKFDTAKRYWQSRDYDLRDPEDDPNYGNEKGGWQIERGNIRTRAANWEAIGGEVQWMTANKAIFLNIDFFSLSAFRASG